MYVYIAPQGFKASAPKAGSNQAKTRPLTLTGTNVERVTLTDAQYRTWIAEPDADKRAAFLAAIDTRKPQDTGRVQVSTAARDEWRERMHRECEAVNAAALAAHEAAVEAYNALDEKAREKATAPGEFVPVAPNDYAKANLRSGIVILDNSAEDTTDETIDALFG